MEWLRQTQGDKVSSLYGVMRQELERLVQSNDQIAAMVLIGSRAKQGAEEPDVAADLDAVVFSDQADDLRASQRWLADLGRIWVDSQDVVLDVLPVRSLLFDDAVALDLVIVPPSAADQAPTNQALARLVSRGFEVVKDTIDLASKLEAFGAGAIRPTQEEFAAVTARFWTEAIRAVKRLGRGEHWVAKHAVDGRMKDLLMQVLTWQARASRGPTWETYWNGRHLETWAGARALEELAGCYATLEPDSIRQALFATMDAFRLVAMETASRLGFDYLEMADRKATVWARTWQ